MRRQITERAMLQEVMNREAFLHVKSVSLSCRAQDATFVCIT